MDGDKVDLTSNMPSSSDQDSNDAINEQRSANGEQFIECSSVASSTDASSAAYRQKWIKLNVGGQHFVTTISTLSKYPKSFLNRLCHPDLNSEKVSSIALICQVKIKSSLLYSRGIMLKRVMSGRAISAA